MLLSIEAFIADLRRQGPLKHLDDQALAYLCQLLPAPHDQPMDILYPISGSDEIMMLTPAQQAYLYKVFPHNRPVDLKEWCESFDIPFLGYDPESYF